MTHVFWFIHVESRCPALLPEHCARNLVKTQMWVWKSMPLFILPSSADYWLELQLGNDPDRHDCAKIRAAALMMLWIVQDVQD